jgi:hypothetical protein
MPGAIRSGYGSRMRTLRLALPTLMVALMLGPAEADATQYRYLCTSIPAACNYTGPNAPTLGAAVCYGTASGIVLKGTAPCPSGTWAYYVDYGEIVDPVANAVAAYVPLDNGCDRPGLCVDGPPPAGAQEYVMCCTSDTQCVHGSKCGGTLWWCNDGVCNEDGTITCFDKEPP